jgi:hypothetical protein
MSYLKSSDIAAYRKKNKPRECPLMKNDLDSYVLDHDHKSGVVRGVISNNANLFLGKIENSWNRFKWKSDISLPECLRLIADYLENPWPSVLHPVGLRQLVKRFKNLRKSDQIVFLFDLGVDKAQIESCHNDEDRINLYRDALKKGFKYERTKTTRQH